MQFKDYKIEFEKSASRINLDETEIDKYLDYAENLTKKGLPIIYDVMHFSLLVGYDSSILYKISNAPEHFYRTFTINKKNGKKRRISEPLPSLKEIQYFIYNEILIKVNTSRYAKAYKKNMSIKDNAKFHKGQKTLICLDIKDFFGSIDEYTVFKMFLGFGYTKQVSMMLSNLCCYKEALPQGAPTSPVISNIVSNKLDEDISKFISRIDSESKVRYTRYADDIAISGMDIKPGYIIQKIRQIAENYNYILNDEKTRVLKSNARQIVTGIVVNEKLQVSREKRKEVRSIMYYISIWGIDEHLKKINIKEPKKKYLQRVLGTVNFVLLVNPKDEVFRQYKNKLIELLKEDTQ